MSKDTLNPLNAANWMMVTPTYRGDYEQFSLLNDSFKKFAPPEMMHQVVVAKEDYEMFKPFQHQRMKLVVSEDILPGKVKKINKPVPMWLSTKFLPVRGWIGQQLIKIQAAATCDRPFILFADSDGVFLKPFSVERFTDGEKTALSRVNNHFEQLETWRKCSADLFKLSHPENFAKVNYVTYLSPWRRDVAQNMLQTIEATSRFNWAATISTKLKFSEYTLYGVFSEEVLGLNEAGHYGWNDPIMNLCWDEPMRTEEEVEALVNRTEQEHIGIMFHSKSDFDHVKVRTVVEKYWAQNS